MVQSRSGRILITLIILLFIFSATALPQCEQHFSSVRSFVISGVNSNPDFYYQNLIVQDLAISGQKKFEAITLKFDYTLEYSADQCQADRVIIRVNPLKVSCSPIFYQGYDISASLKPESADLVFSFKNDNGIVFDSIIFYNVRMDDNPELYSLLTYEKPDPGNVETYVSRAIFHYSKHSYEKFRDQILAIDNYYAASTLADSLVEWTGRGFLSENDTLPVLFLRQSELHRLLQFISPEKFAVVTSGGQNDQLGLNSKFPALAALEIRYGAIIFYNHQHAVSSGFNIMKNDIFRRYLNHFDFFYELSFRTDFRFTNFLNELSTPSFTNASISGIYSNLSVLTDVEKINKRQLSGWFLKAFFDRGNRFEMDGNQFKALIYYRSVLQTSRLLHQENMMEKASQAASRMIGEIARSYIEISQTAAGKDNPRIAAQYFNDACTMISDPVLNLKEPGWLTDYEKMLYEGFEERTIHYLLLKNYSKATAYLTEIQDHYVSNPEYSLPGQFHEWMRQAREGTYLQLLDRANNLMKADELTESEQVYLQAVDIRSKNGYHIEKNILEARLEIVFRQLHYDEYYEEGLRHFQKNEFASSLYYFNKADYLEKSGGPGNVQPFLAQYRQEAARQVILGLLSDGRLKAWAHDFEGAGAVIKQVGEMVDDYGFASSDTVIVAFNELKKNALRTECDNVILRYNSIMNDMSGAEKEQDFIRAYQLSNDAIKLSMANLKCGINDEEAWLSKFRFEPLADYQQMEKDLDLLVDNPVTEYLAAFQELKRYYNKNKLLEEGVVFIPLSERVLQQKDVGFLTGMMDHYLYLKDLDQALKILKRLCELQVDPSLLKQRQEKLAKAMAVRDFTENHPEKPWEILESYTGKDKWYHAFNWSYKLEWLKTSGWKLKFWPFIWRK